MLLICLFVGFLPFGMIPIIILDKVAPGLAEKKLTNPYLEVFLLIVYLLIGYYILKQIPFGDFSIIPDWAYDEARRNAIIDILEPKGM